MSYTGFLTDAIDSLALKRRSPSPYAEQLLALVSQEVIPKLQHSNPQRRSTTGRARADKAQQLFEAVAEQVQAPYPKQVAALTAALVREDRSAADRLIQSLEREPLPAPIICLKVLTPCAQSLGVLWELDYCDFNRVTLATMQLQRIMRDLSRRDGELEQPKGHHHRILLAPVEGEDHSFGLSMVGDFMIRAGWDVAGGPNLTKRDILITLARESFDLVGFSIAGERWLARLKETVEQARARSRNPDLKVLVGGPLLTQRPDLAAACGADSAAEDAPTALRLATELLKHANSAATI